MPVEVDNWAVLIAGLDGIAASFANFTVDRECCLANAYAGLNPETGEDLIDVPPTNSTPEEEVVPVPAVDPLGNDVTDCNGNVVMCPAYLPSVGREVTYIPHQTTFGNDIYCVPGFTYAYAAAGSEPPPKDFNYELLNDAANTAVVAQGPNGPIECPGELSEYFDINEWYDEFPYFPHIAYSCPAIPPDPTAANASDTACGGFQGNAHSSYYKMWQDYLCLYKQNQKWYYGLYGVQLIAGLATVIEGMRCYNDILEQNKEYATNLTANSNDLRRCVVEMLGDGTEENPGVLKDCQNNLLAGHVERIGVINGRAGFMCDSSSDMWDCYTQTMQPLEKQYAATFAAKMFDQICNGNASSDSLLETADKLDSLIDASILPKVSELMPSLLCSSQCPTDNLNEWRNLVREKTSRLDYHYKTYYEEGEKTMIPAVMKMAECLICRVCEARDWLMECAQHDEDTYNASYRANEGHQASEWMKISARSAGKLHESLQWLDCNIPAMATLFHGMKEGFTPMQSRMFQNAQELAPEVVGCFREFQDNAKQYKQQWANCYKDPECAFVTSFFESAQKLMCGYAEQVGDMSKWAEADREYYASYQKIQAEISPEVVRNGALASAANLPFTQWWEGKTKSFYDIWFDNWWECEQLEKQQWQTLMEESNPIRRMVENAERMTDLSIVSIESMKKALMLTNEEMEKALEDPEYFDYCMEQSAVAFVKQVSSYEQENIIRCGSRFAPGATEERLIRTKAAMARSEAAVHALTQRWQWQANRFLEDRQFNRRVTLAGTASGFGQLATSASQLSSADYDRLLGRQREVFGLGQQYVSHAQDAGGRTTQGYTEQASQMFQMLQLWQSTGSLALNTKQQAVQATQQAVRDAQTMISTGQQWTQLASTEKTKASEIINSSLDMGLRLAQIGNFYLEQERAMNSERGNLATAAGGLGTQFTQLGHDLHKSAGAKMEGAMTRGIEGAGVGVGAAQAGHGLMLGALKEENVTTLNALRHVELGIKSMQLALNYISEGSQTYQQSSQLSNNAMTSLLNLFKHSQNSYLLSNSASESCYRQEFEMLCKGKEFAQENYKAHQLALTRGTTGQVLGDLRGELSQTVAGGFGAFGNAAENLIQLNNPTPPMPTGNSLFGAGGSIGV